ncbi:hypothetical protein [Roseovarius bejariae]|uniref:hypothetical protein n=1 Tax=Roseovarius bejariae TaxID=2576383 RepID=UPI001561C208|nr:hypothetical protein [Roseovarius bejariae]
MRSFLLRCPISAQGDKIYTKHTLTDSKATSGIDCTSSEIIFAKKFWAKSAVARGGVLGTLTLETRPGTADFSGQLHRVVSPKTQPANVLAVQPKRPGKGAGNAIEREWRKK